MESLRASKRTRSEWVRLVYAFVLTTMILQQFCFRRNAHAQFRGQKRTILNPQCGFHKYTHSFASAWNMWVSVSVCTRKIENCRKTKTHISQCMAYHVCFDRAVGPRWFFLLNSHVIWMLSGEINHREANVPLQYTNKNIQNLGKNCECATA